MGNRSHGGLKQVRFIESEIGFDGTEADPIVWDKHQLPAEGQEYPLPEVLTEELADGQPAPSGEDVPFQVRAIVVDAADLKRMRDDGYDLVSWDVEFTNLDGGTVKVVKDVILSVIHAPINERGTSGFAQVSGTGTSVGKEKAYDVTQETEA